MSCELRIEAVEVPDVYQGDSMDPVLVGAEGVTNLTGYTCKLEVIGASPSIARPVTDTEGASYLVALTAAETAQLAAKPWTIGVKIEGPAGYKRSVALRLRVVQRVVST